jgi:hypothetical protein
MRKTSPQRTDPKRKAQLENYMKDSKRLRAASKDIHSKLEKSSDGSTPPVPWSLIGTERKNEERH